MALTDMMIRSARPREKRYKLHDGKGLYLSIEANGSKLWRYRYHFAGREKKFSLGPYPTISLAMARDRQIDLRRQILAGVDPAEHRKQCRRSAKVAAANSFEAIAREWILKFSPNWPTIYVSPRVPFRAQYRCVHRRRLMAREHRALQTTGIAAVRAAALCSRHAPRKQ